MVFSNVIFDANKLRKIKLNSSKDFSFEFHLVFVRPKYFLECHLTSPLCDINKDIAVILIVKQTPKNER